MSGAPRARSPVALAVTTASRARARGLVRTRRPEPTRRRVARVGAGRTRRTRSSVTARKLLPQGPFTEEREPLESSPEDVEGFVSDFEPSVRGRRRSRQRARASAFPLADVRRGRGARSGSRRCFPLPRSGPVPATRCSSRSGARGHGSSTSRAKLVNVDDLEVGGVITVFPEGHVGVADSPDAADPASRRRR